MLRAKLNEISELIKEILLNDSFTDRIHPEYLRDAVIAYPSRAGKCLRPALLMWCCGLFNEEKIMRSAKIAAAVELYHVWTLVHDDIIDNDDYRRKALSVHTYIQKKCCLEHPHIPQDFGKKFGIDFAILCGDIQQAWANDLILAAVDDGIPANTVISILRCLNEIVNPDLISGEAMDVYFTLSPITKISPGEMSTMLILKTGKLIRFAAECGALIGLATGNFADESVKRIGDFAEKAALAFQLKDDLLGLFADEAELGKPVGSDLREGKRTFLFSIAANRLQGDDLGYFLDKLGKIDLRLEQTKQVNKMIIECGAAREVEMKIAKLIREAHETLALFPKNQFRDLLGEWIDFIETRTF